MILLDSVYYIITWFDSLMAAFVPCYLFSNILRQPNYRNKLIIILSFLSLLLPVFWYDTIMSDFFLPQIITAIIGLIIGYSLNPNLKMKSIHFVLIASLFIPIVAPLLNLSFDSISRAFSFGIGLSFFVCGVISFFYIIRLSNTTIRFKLLFVILLAIPIFVSTVLYDVPKILDQLDVLPFNLESIIFTLILFLIFRITIKFLQKLFAKYPDPIPVLIGLIIIPLLLWSYSFTLWFTLFVMGTSGFFTRHFGLCENITKYIKSPLIIGAIPLLIMRCFELYDKINYMQPVFASIKSSAIIAPPLGLVSISVGIFLSDFLLKVRGIKIEYSRRIVYTSWWVAIIVLISCCIATMIIGTAYLLGIGLIYNILFTIGKFRRNENFIYKVSIGCFCFLFCLFFCFFQHFTIIPLLAWFLSDRNIRFSTKRIFIRIKQMWVQNKIIIQD